MKARINPDRLISALRNLEIFINDCLDLDYKRSTLSGFDYVLDLLTAAATNSYVETVADHADSLHLAIKKVTPDRIVDAYTRRVAALSPRFGLFKMGVILAFDHTNEDYYGALDSPYVHTWTGENGVEGHWKYLTCSIVSPDGPRVPLLSIPTPIGYDVSHQIPFILQRVKPLVGEIMLCLFDRGFYNKKLMKTLDDADVPYLIFVPKNPQVKQELAATEPREPRTLVYEFEYAADKTTHRGTTTLALLKDVFDPRSEKSYDWAFATNKTLIQLNGIIKLYKQRWGIETGFRVQDEAKIKTKTKDIGIRYFYHAFEQALQFTWGALLNQDAPFKNVILQLYEASKTRVERERAKQARRSRPGA